MIQNSTAVTSPVAATRSTSLIALALSAVLGLGVVFSVGLAQANALHDAAHDVRHANGFPCH
ncbi:CbtB domain-containing protein [Notoacmeibacter ruber]|uniref:CbtB-domain containing protein n=1 Tax=Notoacmeibacter ruber TaxID=2670375 RepID=A0A3L7JAI3_9HYPH|nr:CbtB domain-containing protein [Notoacmeibacter ruber]RLQ87490.1 CbtB-domain containing protein [Notoacmeibacter ruber]